MGRPKLPDEQRKVQVGASLYPADIAKLCAIAEQLGLSRSAVVAMLLHERLEKWNGIKIVSHLPDPANYDGA